MKVFIFYDALENLKNNNNIRVSEEIENDKTLRETVQQVQVMINEIKADAVEMMKLEKELYDIVGPQQNQRTISAQTIEGSYGVLNPEIKELLIACSTLFTMQTHV